ncbi:polysaccharide deacetylase family protein [Mucilaginibacter sp. P25]|uniref:polysaccharide deacetylase family protein n=1 Tax=Mucilaginibacter sp. P25 TaxID=3423945 RepID=UPI003D7A2589
MLTTNHKPIKTLLLTAFIGLQSLQSNAQTKAGTTEITKWQYGKTGAVSLTYDDGSMNQFRKALPVMERLKMPATFFIITGSIPGSKYHGRFIGRPVKEIIKESAIVPTNDQNFLSDARPQGIWVIWVPSLRIRRPEVCTIAVKRKKLLKCWMTSMPRSAMAS